VGLNFEGPCSARSTTAKRPRDWPPRAGLAGFSVEVVVIASEQWSELAGDQVLVVRPDQMIAWRGTAAVDPREI
jgi:hypothetical protein